MASKSIFFLFVLFGLNAFSEDPPEVSLGEKLFRDPRFAASFAFESKGDVNLLRQTNVADPALDWITDAQGARHRNPFRGQSMSCVSCHMVDDAKTIPGLGSRAYSDFSKKSAIPDRGDGFLQTQRNSQSLVNVMIPRDVPALFHFDGEFSDMRDLVLASLTGRNMGWLPHESGQARAQIVKVLREDSGQDELGQKFGGSYPGLFMASNLPEKFRLDLRFASEGEILQRVAEVMTTYIQDLTFSRDENGNYDGSPYDQFLKLNQLPQMPLEKESSIDYALRLLNLLRGLAHPQWVAPTQFQLHAVPAKFGEEELKGLIAFLDPQVGHCFGCHAPPHFSDFKLRNSGVSQITYDAVHGQGSFSALRVPGWEEKRALNAHQLATYQRAPMKENPSLVDLGGWGVFGNPMLPSPQAVFRTIFCPRGACADGEILEKSLATFKTPLLRDLGHSAPYFHSGHAGTLEEAVEFYNLAGALQREGALRNGDVRLSPIRMSSEDVKAIALFLNALNEDYH